jgi:hypothetical protein
LFRGGVGAWPWGCRGGGGVERVGVGERWWVGCW